MPNNAPFGTNAYGVDVRGLDFTVADAPTTKVYHGSSIVVNGNIVGRITSWQATGAYNRGGMHVWELSHNTWGHPVDYVPGKLDGFTVAVSRVEVWQQELEIAFGFPAVFQTLMDQDRPFTIQEYLFRGKSQLYRLWEYRGCWFQDKNEDAQTADGDGIFRVTATIAYVKREKII